MDWRQGEIDRLRAILKTLDPTSKEYGIVLNRIKELEGDVRIDREFELKVEQQTFERTKKQAEFEHKKELDYKSLDHKIRIESEESAHRIELESKEFDHKVELETSEFDLKADETERTLRMKERETNDKGKEAKQKLKHDSFLMGLGGAIKLGVIGALYVFETKGLALPGRIVQFYNGLNK